MRIIHLLLIGISISLAAALARTDSAPAPVSTSAPAIKPKKPSSNISTKPLAAPTTSVKETASKATKPITTTRTAKTLKGAGEARGKRTLYDFGNAGYLYPEIASRRAGYESEAGPSYYPHSGYYSGQNAIAQFPSDFGQHYSHYPQYLEAPEPIIEIIIKDANETLPEEPLSPIITKKKKKEKVHVFYVNYKKDENNKLHLESPIASLNNDETDEEEEEEEIVQIPSVVTPQPPLRSTTLRTIIHPDSEKYHSNSGIHVSFGAEDKSQTGHILEEHDAESIQRHVVALPVGGPPTALGAGVKTDSFAANTRADYSQARSPVSNLLFTSPFHQSHGSSNYYQAQQQLPTQHSNTYFRPPSNAFTQQQNLQLSQTATQFNQHKPQQPQPQRPSYSPAPTIPQPQALYRKPITSPQQQLPQQQSNYYINHNQQYQHQQSVQHNQYYNGLSHKPTQAPQKQAVPSFFPTSLPKQQELPSHQAPAPYQPIKFRPTPAAKPQIKPVPIPVKLENTNYQNSYQQQQQQHHQQHQSQQYQTQQSHSQHQQQPQQQPQAQQQQQQHQQPYSFNRQPQFVQQPSFSVQSPAQQSNNYYKTQQQSSNVQPNSQYFHQKPQINKYQTQSQQSLTGSSASSLSSSASSSSSSQALQSSPAQSVLNNYFNIQPSKETELLKSIPKFEQHITETIHHNIGQQQQQQQHQQQQTQQTQNNYNNFGYNSQNQVIHDIPAPNLGPTVKPQLQQHQHQSSSFLAGLYNAAANQNSQQQQHQAQFSNFVTSSNNVGGSNFYPSSTAATPPQFAESTDGQKIMIVTPMPPQAYNQYHSSQYNQQAAQSQTQSQIIPNSQLQLLSQATINFAQQPRQSATTTIQSTVPTGTSNSHFGVSTYHQDVFKELEQRQNQQKQAVATTLQQSHFGLHSPKTEAQNDYIPTRSVTKATAAPTTKQTTAASPAPSNGKASQTLLQLPDEVPEDLRQQLLSSGILNNADISVLDYDKVGDVALENLPAEHLQHFYGAGGGSQISESHKIVTAVKPNGDKVSLSEKDIERVKQSNSLPQKQNLNMKVVRFDSKDEKSISEKYVKTDATVVPTVDLNSERHYNRYLPLKINGAQFPIPDSEELKGKRVVSVVVLAPVDASQHQGQALSSEIVKTTEQGNRSQRDAGDSSKEVKFLGGDLIKTLVKKPTKENFKRWLEKEARTDVEQQSVVLLVAKASDEAEQEIFMYDITTGAVNKLNGELSSAFVSVAEENASSEDLEHASTLDPSFIESMMHKRRR